MNKSIKIDADGTSSTSKKRKSPGKHPLYRGVRFRGGKWVSEIREPRKAKRIWLGTYQLPEMAAMAFDVAVLALRGRGTKLNFPDKVCSHPKCISSSSSDIQAASFAAAFAFYQETTTTTTLASERKMEHEFMDEEEIFNMPMLVENMAEGMLISPPRMSLASPEASEGESLWSYYN